MHVMDMNGGSAHHGCFEFEVLEVVRSLIFSTSAKDASILEKLHQARELECEGGKTLQSSWSIVSVSWARD